ncbi:hypothetical protein [Pseudoruegeria sp. SK021]|uniref:hypothetical protein n=1 Tax=Pseudoruegeria sp. SK021 TaxID=1933035 RepID=UPI000A21B8ED|nr:hypothetical protein [Pseudoruegeria sp. SK021]OSP56440.1 hypothetical protein BV911_00270 [Pseudoruegeria sp. SK021]
MRLPSIALILVLSAGPGIGQSLPDYLDDRSSPEQVVRSLYNAINRHEYLRGWSYFAPDDRPDLSGFTAGYTDTAAVTLHVGAVASDGAAGTIYWQVPVAIAAAALDGKVSVFAGCYTLFQPQPAVQAVPPFAPIAIKSGALAPASGAAEDAVPNGC